MLSVVLQEALYDRYQLFVATMISNSNYGDVPMPDNIFASDSERHTSESETTESVSHSSD